MSDEAERQASLDVARKRGCVAWTVMLVDQWRQPCKPDYWPMYYATEYEAAKSEAHRQRSRTHPDYRVVVAAIVLTDDSLTSWVQEGFQDAIDEDLAREKAFASEFRLMTPEGAAPRERRDGTDRRVLDLGPRMRFYTGNGTAERAHTLIAGVRFPMPDRRGRRKKERRTNPETAAAIHRTCIREVGADRRSGVERRRPDPSPTRATPTTANSPTAHPSAPQPAEP